MSYVTPEQIAQAKELDLLTYLRSYEPDNLVHFSGNTYCTREHDSLKISNGKWNWFSRGIGGKTALVFLAVTSRFDGTNFGAALRTIEVGTFYCLPFRHLPILLVPFVPAE